MTSAARLTLIVLAAALALAGLTAGYVKWELAEPDAFADPIAERAIETAVAGGAQITTG